MNAIFYKKIKKHAENIKKNADLNNAQCLLIKSLSSNCFLYIIEQKKVSGNYQGIFIVLIIMFRLSLFANLSNIH